MSRAVLGLSQHWCTLDSHLLCLIDYPYVGGINDDYGVNVTGLLET